MASTTFSGPVTSTNGFVGSITGDVVGAVKLTAFTVATAPSAATAGAGTMIYVSDGAAGSPVVAFSDGTDFLRVDTLAAIAAA
jgi:hypothetical protein